MRRQMLGKSMLEVPVVAAGCMRFQGMDETEVDEYIHTCLELGIQFFDHADIYGKGACESLFGRVFEQTEFRREDIILQSKCGIVPGVMYDFSKEHILQSVEESLRRLRTDYLDILLLHRPDALMEPEEVAEAFDLLEGSGKVRHFGVSNHTPMQIQLLKKCVRQDLLVNQLQFSIPFSNMVASGLEANMLTDLAEKYGTTKTGIASAWIFRHPAKIQMVAGTTNLKRLREIALAADIRLTREEWYQLYLSAGHILP